MPKKKHPSVTSLNTLGYNVIRDPRTGIAPLDIIGKRDSVDIYFGVSLFTSALAVFGMSALSLDLRHSGATRLPFSYADVSLTYDDPTDDISFGIAPGASAGDVADTGVIETEAESNLSI